MVMMKKFLMKEWFSSDWYWVIEFGIMCIIVIVKSSDSLLMVFFVIEGFKKLGDL